MTTHFEFVELVHEQTHQRKLVHRPSGIGCGCNAEKSTRTLDGVTCGRCKRSRPYKVCRAYLLDLIDKKMLNKLGFCAPKRL